MLAVVVGLATVATALPAEAVTTISATKECGTAPVSIDDWTESISGTLVKVGATDCPSVTLTRGVADNLYRVFDQTDNTGHLGQLTIQKVDAQNLRRGFLRVRQTDAVLVEDCKAIGNPAATDKGDVPGGIATADYAVPSMTVRRCVLDSWQGVPGSTYTNGDGGATEELVTSLWEDISASHNADAGLDLKGKATVRRFLGEDNHRTLRAWGSLDASDVTSVNARNAAVWVGGGTRFTGGTVNRLTIVEAPGSTVADIKVDGNAGPGTLTIIDPVTPGNRPLRISEEAGNQVNVVVKYTQPGGVVAARPAPPSMTDAPPSVPTNVTAAVDQTTKVVTVKGNVPAGTTKVNIYETVHADSNVPRTPAPVISGTTFTWTSTARPAGSYKYQAQACNAAGCSTRVATSPSTVTVN